MELSKDSDGLLLQWGWLSSANTPISCQIVDGNTNPSANRTTPSTDVIELCCQFRNLSVGGQCRIDVGDGDGFTAWSATADPFDTFDNQIIDLNADYDWPGSNNHGWNGSIEILKIAAGLHSLDRMRRMPTPVGI